MRTLIFICMCLIFVIPSQAEIITVDDDSPADFNNIQAAIDAARHGDEIVVGDGTYTGPGNRDIDFLGKAITVRSESGPNNCIIDCEGTETEPHRGFKFHSGEGPDSVVAGLMITNGYGQDEDVHPRYMSSAGGAIFCIGSNPTIMRCKIKGNLAGYKGGGIYCEESNPTITNCTFSQNSASYGGGVYCRKSSPTVTNCAFTRNQTNYPHMGFGAGMATAVNSNPIVTNCTFSGNTADSQAGGMYNGDYCTATITNCIFRGNSADYGSGMFNSWYSSPKVTNCIFSENSAGDKGGGMLNSRHARPTVGNCTFVRNSASSAGGGMYNYQSSPRLTNCILWGNSDSGGTDRSAQIQGSGAVINYCCIQGWTGNLWGTGNIGEDPLFVNSAIGDYHLSEFSPCIDVGDPNYRRILGETDIDGEPRMMSIRIDIGADEFTLPLIPVIEVSSSEFVFVSRESYPNPKPQSLSIRNKGSGTLNWRIEQNCQWLDVEPNSGVSIIDENEVTLSVDITGLTVGDYNCDIAIVDPNSFKSLQTVVVNLTILNYVDALYVPSDYETIQAAIDTAVDFDTIIVVDGVYTGEGNQDIDFKGKAITVRSTDPNDPNIIAATIIRWNGTWEGRGCGFYFHSGERPNSVMDGLTVIGGFRHGISCYNSSPTIRNCIVKECSVVGISSLNSSPTISNCAINRNSGGIYCYESSPTITNCIISGNGSMGWDPWGETGLGSGIYCKDSSPTITNCTITDNRTDGYGGGIFCDEGNPTITNCTISGNYATEGAGIDCGRGSAVIDNCIITENSFSRRGGGVSCDSSNLTITNSTITENTPRDSHDGAGGGGIFAVESTVEITNCAILNNSATFEGGGIHCYTKHDEGSLTITNSIINGNSAGLEGGGIFSRGRVAITSTTIANNTANGPGGAIYAFDYAALEITNSILWANSPEQIYYRGYTPTVTYSDVQGGWEGERNIDADPCFVESGYWDSNGAWFEGDYHLLEDSPCIDAGDPNYIPEPNETDLDGNPRIVNDRIDMGAYEFAPAIEALVKIRPKTLNLRSKGKWIMCVIRLPEDYNVADIDPNSILLEDEIEADRVWLQEEFAVAKFSRMAVQEELTELETPAEVELIVSGELSDGTIFEGTDTIRVIDKGKRRNNSAGRAGRRVILKRKSTKD